VRKSKAEAADTRRRIVRTAADEFRLKGIEGAGLNDLMASAGLTHGGFYRHFESKDQLVAEAFSVAASSVTDKLRAYAADAEPGHGLEAAVLGYLSTTHRDDPTFGCPIAALGSELVRQDPALRADATRHIEEAVEVISAELKRPFSPAARRKALSVLSTMVGALTLSRLVTDDAMSDAILEQAAADILARPGAARGAKGA
jgi:TetR/AcrR family transcriptional repressor of nem operon